MVGRNHLMLSAALALALAVGVATYVRSVERAYDLGTRPVEVLVASRRIEARSVLKDGDITTARVPGRLVLTGAMRQKDGAVGKITRTTIYPGEQFLKSKLVSPGPGEGLAALIPSGRRAVTVKMEADAGLTASIKPGDLVDVVSVLPEADGGPGRAVTIIQAIPVMAVCGTNPETGTSALASINEPAVVLAASPEEAQVLALAQEAGSLRFVVRHPSDRIPSSVNPASLAQIVESPVPKRMVPKPSVQKPRFVEVIRVTGERDSGPIEEVQEVLWQSE